eukprot:CAMPEP_0183350234 /NCGR_PEP_ID=MMETSP0164_2-20130417/18328_1 /TAXON_ID=221442 /ORGANISM="Coccolithus pelagicus ssp braarudi, Strain PLY182g" /LENGTH=130 /DNA_ID=CAMNT_0025522121 /DNA_START=49 /DNA_END=441 /DNA_ORIENTATION=+
MSKSLVVAWGEYFWARLRRLDYWNKAYTITNLPGTMYRPHSPGSGPAANIMRKGEENIYSIRYFQRDYKRRDTEYYPDTPLSLNHALMKGKQIRPDSEPCSHLPVVGAFGGKKYATMDTLGVQPSKGLDL